MWFTDGVKLGRITTTGSITGYPTVGAPNGGIIVGPDGALWFVEFGEKQYGRISPADGTVTEYALVPAPAGTLTVARLAFGSDGLLYITDDGSNPGVYAVVPATGTIVKRYTFAKQTGRHRGGPGQQHLGGLGQGPSRESASRTGSSATSPRAARSFFSRPGRTATSGSPMMSERSAT